MKRYDDFAPIPRSQVRSAEQYPRTTTVGVQGRPTTTLTKDSVRYYLRHLGITEQVWIHEQNIEQFLEEKGLKELGRGGEGTVYFLRGHVVKVVNPASAPAALREVAHMLHLNRTAAGNAMGERSRDDWPALLWVYILSDGSLSIGMKPFDNDEQRPGSTLYERLNFGPALQRVRIFDIVRSICQSLVHCHRNGVIHHDLKPANIFIPGDDNQRPVVFDLGQALWQQSSWGKQWLRHEHNAHYWYNGTYRYMHHPRRLAHLAALAKSVGQNGTATQEKAFHAYVPTYYDDVIAYARIIRDILKSPHTMMTDDDRKNFRNFYQSLMGLQHIRKETGDLPKETGLIKRLSSVFKQSNEPVPAPPPKIEQRWGSMDQVQSELDRIPRPNSATKRQ